MSDEPHSLHSAQQQAKSLEDEHDYDYVDPNTLETLRTVYHKRMIVFITPLKWLLLQQVDKKVKWNW